MSLFYSAKKLPNFMFLVRLYNREEHDVHIDRPNV